jgi:Enoyl-CoA hydratase/isomerase
MAGNGGSPILVPGGCFTYILFQRETADGRSSTVSLMPLPFRLCCRTTILIPDLSARLPARGSLSTVASYRHDWGFCMGGGMATGIGCDIRIATGDSLLGVPASRLRLDCGSPTVRQLVNLAGPSFTKEIFLTARHFAATEALTIGLANRVVPGNGLKYHTRACCAAIAESAPMRMNTLKCIVAKLPRGHEADSRLCGCLEKACLASQD